MLYAQNGKTMVKNAVWLAIIMWVLAIVVFIVMLTPAAAIVYYMPGALAGWSFVLAIILAWAVKAALLEPFAIAALMQVYFKVIEGQDAQSRMGQPPVGGVEAIPRAEGKGDRLARRRRLEAGCAAGVAALRSTLPKPHRGPADHTGRRDARRLRHMGQPPCCDGSAPALGASRRGSDAGDARGRDRRTAAPFSTRQNTAAVVELVAIRNARASGRASCPRRRPCRR